MRLYYRNYVESLHKIAYIWYNISKIENENGAFYEL